MHVPQPTIAPYHTITNQKRGKRERIYVVTVLSSFPSWTRIGGARHVFVHVEGQER